MRAIVHEKYGPLNEVLSVQEAETPTVAEGEVLVRVQAASIHIGDCHGMRGVPYVMRPIFGLRKPKARVPGTDMAGVVEQVGSGVTTLKPGDEVFGWGKGAFAELALAPEDQLLPKPADLTFEQAAALGVSAITGLVAIRDEGKVQAGQKVLVNGASGGVGTFAVQVAKALGAEVTGVCSGRNAALVRSIGADHIIDYTKEDFTQGGPVYDLILDNVGNHSFSDLRRAVASGGKLLSNGAPVNGWFGGLDHVVEAMVQSIFSRKQGRPFVAMGSIERLTDVRDLAETGDIKPVIDSSFPLEQGPEAILHVVDGHAAGTVVITMDSPPAT
jgi:NADPH:quinone reductase-like Zn-dependent oxidoreductase